MAITNSCQCASIVKCCIVLVYVFSFAARVLPSAFAGVISTKLLPFLGYFYWKYLLTICTPVCK